MTAPAITTDPQATRRRRLRAAALAAVVLVPLAFAGLFVAAVSQGDTALDRIPAAIVNEDSLVEQQNPDGTTTNVFAGRLLVTELTGEGSAGFDWTITNAEDAERMLADGDVYAVLTVPADFSTSVMSISGQNPVKADLSIRTDDAHSYLTGSVVQAVGSGMVSAFGNEITEQYIAGLTSGLGTLGESLTQAAEGAGKLADGAGQLGDGLGTYTDGVSSLSGGLSRLDSGAAGLTTLSGSITQYTQGVGQLSSGLAQLNTGLQANPFISAPEKQALQGIVDGLAGAASGGSTLSSQAGQALSGVRSGIAQSAKGAAQLAAGGPALVEGADGLTSGADELADGLSTGAEQVPASDPDAAAASAKVAADPVTLTVTTDNKVGEIGQVIATFFVPLGLWVGALAVFLVLRPVTRRALATSAGNGRLVVSTLARALAVTVAQAALLVLLLHVSLGVAWSSLPATAGFALLVAGAFTAFHHLLMLAFGRVGLVVSLFLLAVQVTSTGGIYPIQLLAEPFQFVSPFLPLTYAVAGMQGIITGATPGTVWGSVVILALFGVGSVLLALVAVRRTRRAAAIGLVPQGV